MSADKTRRRLTAVLRRRARHRELMRRFYAATAQLFIGGQPVLPVHHCRIVGDTLEVIPYGYVDRITLDVGFFGE